MQRPKTRARQIAMGNPVWESFQIECGARRVDPLAWQFADPATETALAADTDVRINLDHLALLRANGDDATSFLQGQLSNDIRQLDQGGSHLSAYCNAKGRMLALFRIFRHNDDYVLQLPRSVAAATLQRLKMFVLRAKVALDDADAHWAQFGLSGPHVASHLQEWLPDVPTQADARVRGDGYTVVRLAGPHPRFLLVGEPEILRELWTRVTPHTQAVGTAAWRWLDIRAGIPSVHTGTVEEFVPQMTNLELIGGVNFKKGCYPGQEIVARMHYLGRLKQRMVAAHLAADAAVGPGTPIFAPDFPNQTAGSIVDAQPAPAGGWDVLVVAQISSITQGELHVGRADGARLTIRELPYPVPLSA